MRPSSTYKGKSYSEDKGEKNGQHTRETVYVCYVNTLILYTSDVFSLAFYQDCFYNFKLQFKFKVQHYKNSTSG
jgi:hypothetical protein